MLVLTTSSGAIDSAPARAGGAASVMPVPATTRPAPNQPPWVTVQATMLLDGSEATNDAAGGAASAGRSIAIGTPAPSAR